MSTIAFNQKDYLTAVRDQFSSFMKPDHLHAALRTAAKRVARHHGQISKYDGQGRLRQGFPPGGDAGGRAVLPDALATTKAERMAHVKRRQSNNGGAGRLVRKWNRERLENGRGVSKKGFIDRIDGGYGD